MGKQLMKWRTSSNLGSNISKGGGSEQDIQVRIGKARTAFAILTPVWRSKVIPRKTKLRIFNTNVKSVLLYGSVLSMESNKSNLQQAAVLRQQMPEVHHGHPLARGHKE